MNVENKIEEQGLSISDIIFIIKRNIMFIILVTVICTLAGTFYGLTIKKPSFTATSTAVVVIDNPSSTNQTANYVYATYYTSTFTSFIKSNPVLKKACDLLETKGIDIDRATLADSVSIVAQSDSLIITINATVTNKNSVEGSENAVLIANTLLEAAIEVSNLKEIRDGKEEFKYKPFANNLIEMEQADIEDVTKSRGAFTIIVICILLGIVLSFGLCLIKYLLDDTYNSKESFERTYGINVLALIPELVEYNDGGKK